MISKSSLTDIADAYDRGYTDVMMTDGQARCPFNSAIVGDLADAWATGAQAARLELEHARAQGEQELRDPSERQYIEMLRHSLTDCVDVMEEGWYDHVESAEFNLRCQEVLRQGRKALNLTDDLDN